MVQLLEASVYVVEGESQIGELANPLFAESPQTFVEQLMETVLLGVLNQTLLNVVKLIVFEEFLKLILIVILFFLFYDIVTVVVVILLWLLARLTSSCFFISILFRYDACEVYFGFYFVERL